MKIARMLLPVVLATPLAAQEYRTGDTHVFQAVYECARGVMIPATYVNTDAGTSLAVLQIEGRQVAMRDAPTGSGARYVSIDEQVGYRWYTKGDEAFLAYLAADDAAEEETLLRDCRMLN